MKDRNYGIDILKILAMFFILILHIDNKGGLFKFSSQSSLQYNIIMILEIIAICAVNIYGIVSGYLSYSNYDKKSENMYNFKRLIYLWFQVLSYSLIITLVFMFLGKYSISKLEFILIFFPVASSYLWYFTAYFLLFLFMPMINSFVKNTDNRFLIVTLISIIVLFSFYQTAVIKIGSFTFTNNGYSVWWLFILFYIGAVIKKTGIGKDISTKKLIIYLISIYIVSYLWKVVLPLFENNFEWLRHIENFLFLYTSPSNLFVAIIYLLIFSRIKLNNSKIAKILTIASSATFGVYVIHLHPCIWEKIGGAFTFILDFNIFLEPFIVLLVAFILLIILLIIDIIRFKIFKLLRVEKLCLKIDKLLCKVLNKVSKIVLMESNM